MDEDLDALSRDPLVAEVKRLRHGIRKHRDASGPEWPAESGAATRFPVSMLPKHAGRSRLHPTRIRRIDARRARALDRTRALPLSCGARR